MATVISGSGPAYVFLFIECLVTAGVKIGLDRDLALALSKETIRGAVEMAKSATVSPEQLRREVTSPNGTTAAALSVLSGHNQLSDLITKAVTAAHQRAIEISSYR